MKVTSEILNELSTGIRMPDFSHTNYDLRNDLYENLQCVAPWNSYYYIAFDINSGCRRD